MSEVTSFTVRVLAMVPTAQYESIHLELSETTTLAEDDDPTIEEQRAIEAVISELVGIIRLMDNPGATHWTKSVVLHRKG